MAIFKKHKISQNRYRADEPVAVAKVFPESTLLQDRARTAVLRKIFLAPYGRSVFPAKILS